MRVIPGVVSGVPLSTWDARPWEPSASVGCAASIDVGSTRAAEVLGSAVSLPWVGRGDSA